MVPRTPSEPRGRTTALRPRLECEELEDRSLLSATTPTWSAQAPLAVAIPDLGSVSLSQPLVTNAPTSAVLLSFTVVHPQADQLRVSLSSTNGLSTRLDLSPISSRVSGNFRLDGRTTALADGPGGFHFSGILTANSPAQPFTASTAFSIRVIDNTPGGTGIIRDARVEPWNGFQPDCSIDFGDFENASIDFGGKLGPVEPSLPPLHGRAPSGRAEPLEEAPAAPPRDAQPFLRTDEPLAPVTYFVEAGSTRNIPLAVVALLAPVEPNTPFPLFSNTSTPAEPDVFSLALRPTGPDSANPVPLEAAFASIAEEALTRLATDTTHPDRSGPVVAALAAPGEIVDDRPASKGDSFEVTVALSQEVSPAAVAIALAPPFVDVREVSLANQERTDDSGGATRLLVTAGLMLGLGLAEGPSARLPQRQPRSSGEGAFPVNP